MFTRHSCSLVELLADFQDKDKDKLSSKSKGGSPSSSPHASNIDVDVKGPFLSVPGIHPSEVASSSFL